MSADLIEGRLKTKHGELAFSVAANERLKLAGDRLVSSHKPGLVPPAY